LLREALPPSEYRVVAPDLNRPSFEKLRFEAIVEAAVRAAREARPDVVVGSSLGALVALEAARRGGTAPLVLIAPALGFGARWTSKLAPGDPVRFFHHGQGKDLEIHRTFFEEMSAVTVDRDPPKQKVIVIMGEQDESVPFHGVKSTWDRWEASGHLAAGARCLPLAYVGRGLVVSIDCYAWGMRLT